MRRATHDAELASRLDALYHDYNREDSASDPIQKVRPFADPADREIAGFCAAALAFGRVASVLNSIDNLFSALGARPADFVRRFEPESAPPTMRSMGHRWIRGDDLVALLWMLRQMIDRSGSIERFFAEGLNADDEDVGPALDSFSKRSLGPEFAYRGRACRKLPALRLEEGCERSS